MITNLDSLMANLRIKLPDYLALQGIDTSQGKKFQCLHKDHDDSSPSMSLFKDSFAKCFSCNGPLVDIFTAAHLLEDKPLVGEEFITENVMYLAEKFNVDVRDIKLADGKKYVDQALRYNYLRAYKIAAEFLQETTDKSPIDAFLKEIRRRKWAQKESIKLGVVGGCAFNEMLTILRQANFSDEFIKTIGLWRPDIFNIDSIVFVIYDEHYNPIAFYSRDTRFEEKKAEYDRRDFSNEIIKEKAPIKYNSSSNFGGVYEKSLFPYGIHSVKNFHRIIAVEGHGCRHNLKLNGYDNVIALGGGELPKSTLEKLSSFGVTNICLFLDNDVAGVKKVKQIIKEYYGKMSIEFSILDMSEYADIKDPDELIRKHGGDAIKLLQDIHCLEWLAMKELELSHDQYEAAKVLSEFIALEKSPINRVRLINSISFILDVLPTIITEEVDQKISKSQDRKSEFALKILDEAKDLIRQNPNALNAAMKIIESRLLDLDKDKSSGDLFSAQECMRSLANLKDKADAGVIEPIIRTGWRDLDDSSPFPTREAFCLLVAAPNVGKSALIISLIPGILDNNDDAMVVVYTNDDSRDIYFNRLIALLAKMPVKWIERPKMYLDAEKKLIRDAAFRKVMDWISSERLVIKDISHGNTVEFYGDYLLHYRNKYPDRNIFSTCDNLHRMRTETELSGDKERIMYISSMIKSYTVKYSCVAFCTVEMTKASMYERITDCNAIAETAALQYDANLIIFLWNEVAAMREKAKKYFMYDSMDFIENHGYVIKPIVGPVVEAIFLKNKTSEFKGSIFFKFFPSVSLFDQIGSVEAESLVVNTPENSAPPKREEKRK